MRIAMNEEAEELVWLLEEKLKLQAAMQVDPQNSGRRWMPCHRVFSWSACRNRLEGDERAPDLDGASTLRRAGLQIAA